jgi:HD-GYP domain-containing protein (c-di-GMP phosphodiesterase class II)
VAVADVFDSLVSHRCYKKPWSIGEALDLLRREAGGHFDPALVESLLELGDMLPLIYERFPEIRQAEGTGAGIAGAKT